MTVELAELEVGDEPDAWEAAGFTVGDDDTIQVGAVRIRLAGHDGGRRIRSWTLRGVDPAVSSVDGIVTRAGTEPDGDIDGDVPAHPNGVVAIDHVVLLSPDLARTTGALEALGVGLRRTRQIDESQYGFPAVQSFFRLGEPILELIGASEPTGDGPSGFFGLAYTVADLDALPDRYGEALGRVKDAVQPGRRIATLRHKQLDLSVATAFMTPP
ncbi:MAG TPA: hypothetical protein VFG94_14900 [Acidimicrobiales bacterium]|nr:hypothetical protein [Acidimicrobiales bacterium]